jgi:four helix bundle protein
MDNPGKIRDFKDLIVWQEGHKLVLTTYRITKDFPREEIFGLTSQMRRSAASITANVAEGFGRRGVKEKSQFYYMAHGSLTELKDQLLIARDIGYLTDTAYSEINKLSDKVHALLRGLISKNSAT